MSMDLKTAASLAGMPDAARAAVWAALQDAEKLARLTANERELQADWERFAKGWYPTATEMDKIMFRCIGVLIQQGFAAQRRVVELEAKLREIEQKDTKGTKGEGG